MTLLDSGNHLVANSFEQCALAGVRLSRAFFIILTRIAALDLRDRSRGRYCRGAPRAWRHRSNGINGPSRAKRRGQRDGQDPCIARDRMVIDHQLPRILEAGAGARDLRCAVNSPGWLIAEYSSRNEPLVPTQDDLRHTRILRSAFEGLDRTHFRGFANSDGILGIEQRRRLYDCALYGRVGAGLLGAALDRALGAAQRFAQNASSAQVPC
jgi:hypothetical protein